MCSGSMTSVEALVGGGWRWCWIGGDVAVPAVKDSVGFSCIAAMPSLKARLVEG